MTPFRLFHLYECAKYAWYNHVHSFVQASLTYLYIFLWSLSLPQVILPTEGEICRRG